MDLAINHLQRSICHSTNQPTQNPKVAQPNWGPFGLESAIDFDTPSSTIARRPSQGQECIKSRSRHVCQNIAWIRQWGLLLYKECIGDKKVARRPEDGQTEVGGLSATNLPLVSIPHPARLPDGPAKVREVYQTRPYSL